jgi:predicted phage terminase large subunit-like protein
MEPITLAEVDGLLRKDPCALAQRCFHELYPSKPFEWNWHLEVMAAKLQALRSGKTKRQILCAPPRHMKSFFVSVVLPIWWLGLDPTAQIICLCYGEGLSEMFARERLALMSSPFYQRIFDTRLTKQSVLEIATTAGGGCFSTSVGGSLTGRGADLIILDDVIKADEARSDARRNLVNAWFNDSVVPRLNDQRTGRIILCMHRLHQDDLVGHLLEQGQWDILSLPAIAEQDEAHVIDTPLGQVCFRRKEGELLHPARVPQEVVDRVRKDLGPYNFAGQYQQSPAPLGGGLVKAEWFGRYRSRGELPPFDQIVQSWDTATRPSELNSFSVCITWGIKDKDYYVLDVLRRRLNYPALKRVAQQHAREFDPTIILIEDRSSGTQLIEDLIEEGVPGVTRYVPKGKKAMRLHRQTGVIEAGFVHLPRSARWLADFLDEVTNFPESNHDDQVVSMSQFLSWQRSRSHPLPLMQVQPLGVTISMGGRVAPTAGPNYGFAFVNDANAGPRKVRLRVPTPGPTHVEIWGVSILVPTNRIIEVNPGDAPSLRFAGFVDVRD